MTKVCELCGSQFGRTVWPSGNLEARTRFEERRFCSQLCAKGGLSTPIERFMDKVRRDPSGCWLWTGSTNGKYPKFSAGTVDGRTVLVYAHRWSYEHFVGAIPEGLQIDHLCRVVTCVNPEHLEPVTSSENKMRIPAHLRKRPNLYEIHARRRARREGAA